MDIAVNASSVAVRMAVAAKDEDTRQEAERWLTALRSIAGLSPSQVRKVKKVSAWAETQLGYQPDGSGKAK